MNWSDIFLVPADFCTIASRKDVDPSIIVAGTKLSVPIISSNMDTVYSKELAHATAKAGAISCVHRFCSIEDNKKLFLDGIYENKKPWVSVGINDDEFNRAKALVEVGAEVILIDVANAACEQAVMQFKRIKKLWEGDVQVVVGNFTTHIQIQEFLTRSEGWVPDAIKISIGSGSNCLTEKYVVGAALPPVQTVLDCGKAGIPMIFDGGFDSPRSLNAALALGCSAAMMGKQFAGTFESSGEKCFNHPEVGMILANDEFKKTYSYYRGSAAADSYADQGKTAAWRPVEGKHSYVEITGSVSQMLQQYEAALRSALTYCNARTLEDFIGKVKWGVKQDLLWPK